MTTKEEYLLELEEEDLEKQFKLMVKKIKLFDLALKIRWLAAIISSLMYASFYDQARINCSGSIGSIWLASAALVSCILWVFSSYYREKIDWQTIIACTIGIITTTIAIITAVQPAIICLYIR